jgi:hypothetical protein
MCKIKIAYLISTPYSKRDHDRFGIETLRRHGFSVQIWDVTKFFLKKRGDKISGGYVTSDHIELSNKRQIKEFLEKDRNKTLVISLSSFEIKLKFIFDIMNKNKNIRYLTIKHGKCPSASMRIKEITYTLTLKKLIRGASSALRAVLEKRSYKPTSIIYTYLGGEKVKEKKDIISHSLDYNFFLANVNNKEKLVDGDYAVFLDGGEAGYSHPDLTIRGMDELISFENYFREVNEYFDFFESQYKIPVVIATHPRVAYQGSEYKGRKMIKNSTYNLVKNSKLILAHYSTAINFAVIHKKPIFILRFSNNYRNCSNKKLPDAWIAALGAKNYETLGSPLDFKHSDDLYAVDQESYSNYLNTHIKYPGSPEIDTWEYLSEWIDTNSWNLFNVDS